MDENRYRITKEWIDKFQRAINDLRLVNPNNDDIAINIEIACLSSLISDLQEELNAMENENNG